jgi:uncharacterized oxidoreductase
MKQLHVQGAPSFYICEEGALDQLEALLSRYGFKKGVVIHGKESWRVAQPFFPKFQDIQLRFEHYRGECSDSETERVAQICQTESAEFILGVGGGKVLDLAKAVANHIRINAVLVPTLASTCAAWTSLSVIYSDSGEFVRLHVYPRTTLMVVIEPRIFLDSPINYLKAGIGDTLAKWYEAEVLTRNKKDLRVPVEIALKGARLCKDLVLQNSAKAIASLEQKKMSPELMSIIELNIMVAGMVGGFGDHYVRIAAAHSVHNGLTRLHETHHLLHGEKVAYGILIQLALEGDWAEIDALMPLYKELQFPYSLATLGIPDVSDEQLAIVAEGALAPDESIHFMDQKFTVVDLIQAFRQLDERYAN